MTFTRATTITLLTCAGLGVSDMISAQARGPSRWAPRQVERSVPTPADEAAAREAKLAELEEWLGRLVGKFRLQGTVSTAVGGGIGPISSAALDTSGVGQAHCTGGQCYLERDPRGVGECRHVGAGPGVQCRIDVPWPQMTFTAGPFQGGGGFGSPNLEGARILYGIDPDNLGIRFLMVDGKSLAIEALGFLEGSWAVFTTRCVNYGDDNCKWEFRIRIRGDSRPIEMQFDSSIFGYPVPIAKYAFTMRREAQVRSDEALSAADAEQH